MGAISLPLLAVCGYIFLVIERPWESVTFLQGVQLERAYAILLLFIALLRGRLKVVASPTNKWVYGLLALHFVLAPFAYVPGFAVEQGVEYAKMIVLYLLMLAVADDEISLRTLVKAFVFSMFFYVLHSLWEYGNGRHVWRMGISRMVGVDSTLNDPNAFGASVVLSLPFVAVLLKSGAEGLFRKFCYLYCALAVVCVVLTGSRSSFAALFLLVLLWVSSRHGVGRVKLLLVSIPMVLMVWMVMPAEKQDRIRTMWNPEAGPENAQTSAEGRLEGFKVAFKMFKREPLTGVGAGGKNFIMYRMDKHMDEEGHESPTQSHNLYGEVLAELGAPGLLLLLGMAFSTFRCSLFVRRVLASRQGEEGFFAQLALAIMGALVLLLFLGLAGHNFYRPMWLWLAAWAGIMFRILKSNKTEALRAS